MQSTDLHTDLTATEVREWLDYDPATGILTWKETANGRVKVGMRAGTLHHTGYRIITLLRRIYMEHRIIWLWVYGEWPEDQIDHCNRIKDDNRICNLRQATRLQNAVNSRPRRNKFGLRGVRIDARCPHKPFFGTSVVEGKRIYTKNFATAEEAAAAILADQQRRWGEFVDPAVWGRQHDSCV